MRIALSRPGTLRRRCHLKLRERYLHGRHYKESKSNRRRIPTSEADEEQGEPEIIREEGEIEQAAETEEDSINRRFIKIQHRQQISEIHTDKPHRRKAHRGQKGDGRLQ